MDTIKTLQDHYNKAREALNASLATSIKAKVEAYLVANPGTAKSQANRMVRWNHAEACKAATATLNAFVQSGEAIASVRSHKNSDTVYVRSKRVIAAQIANSDARANGKGKAAPAKPGKPRKARTVRKGKAALNMAVAKRKAGKAAQKTAKAA